MMDVIDLVNAVRGKKHCDWCSEHKPRWLWRVLKLDQIPQEGERRSWLARFVVKSWDIQYKVGIWKISQWWHWRYHETR